MRSKILSILILFIIFCTFVLLLIPFNTHLMSSNPSATGLKPVIIAHRGASGFAPENTLAAIELAMNSSAEIIEIDVHLTKDGEVVVIHDKSVDRTTNGTGLIGDLTLAQIRELDAGSWFSESFAGQKIPFLSEVMEMVNGQKKLLIEIKSGVKDFPGIDAKVVEMIKQYDALDWCIVQSFDDKTLIEINRQWPEVCLHKLIVFKFRLLPLSFDGSIRHFSHKKYSFVDAINPHYKFINKRFVKNRHKAGFGVNVWGEKDSDSYQKIRHIPVDGWITDFPPAKP
jgi:glycerophosphoryl diester phosphodiesterase